MICWRCHSNSVNTRSCLPRGSDVKTWKRRNVVGIDMIWNNRIAHLEFNKNHLLTHFFFQIEIINSHTELLPVYVLIGRLIQKFPGLSNKFLQHYGLYMYCCVMSDIVQNSHYSMGLLWSWSFGSWIYNYTCNQCLLPPKLESCSWWGVLGTTLFDQVCQWLVTAQWFSPGLWFPSPIRLTATI